MTADIAKVMTLVDDVLPAGCVAALKFLIMTGLYVGAVTMIYGSDFEGYNWFVAVAQFVACFGFFPTAGALFYEAACVIFAVTCFVGTIQSVRSLLGVPAHWKEDVTADENQ